MLPLLPVIPQALSVAFWRLSAGQDLQTDELMKCGFGEFGHVWTMLQALGTSFLAYSPWFRCHFLGLLAGRFYQSGPEEIPSAGLALKRMGDARLGGYEERPGACLEGFGVDFGGQRLWRLHPACPRASKGS